MSNLAPLRSQLHWKAAGLLVPGLLLCSVASADRIERHFKVEAHPVVTIHNPNGMVTVRAWTKSDVMVVAKRATAQVEVDAEQNGNRVDVLTRQVADTASPDDLRTDLEISVPQDAELQIHNDAGGVNVSNVLGDMNVETIAAGVPLGRKSAFQVPASKSARPCSCAVASAGRFGERFRVRMASALTVWLSIWGIATVMVGHQ